MKQGPSVTVYWLLASRKELRQGRKLSVSQETCSCIVTLQRGVWHLQAPRIEGTVTCFVAVYAIFVLPDFPASTRWLIEERRLALRRMKEDVGVGDQGEGHMGYASLRRIGKYGRSLSR